MIKEAGFLWSAAMGNLLLCFLPSLLLCFLPSLLLCFLPSLPAVSFGFSCRVSISSQRDFSRIAVGFQQAFRLSTKAWISVRKTPLITF